MSADGCFAPKSELKQHHHPRGVPPVEALEQLARRRYQKPKPEIHGKYWTIVVRKDEFRDGKLVRTRERVRLALANEPERKVLKLRDDYVRPLNTELSNIGSATNFQRFTEDTYRELEMPELAETTQQRYRGVIERRFFLTGS